VLKRTPFLQLSTSGVAIVSMLNSYSRQPRTIDFFLVTVIDTNALTSIMMHTVKPADCRQQHLRLTGATDSWYWCHKRLGYFTASESVLSLLL